MTSRAGWTVATFMLLSAFAVAARADEGCHDLAGTWVLPVHGHDLIALEVEAAAADHPTAFVGSLTAPQHLAWSATSFSQITGANQHRTLSGATCAGGVLSFAVEKPDAPGAPSRFSLAAAGPGQARMQLIVQTEDPAAIAPFDLVRAPGKPRLADDWNASRVYWIAADPRSNAEMLALFDADQAALTLGPFDRQHLVVEGAERRRATRRLLDAGALRSGEDFRWAAFLFQHGSTPRDFLLAHTLAMVAVAKGDRDALWISTATLDRYLQHVHQPQIYGTQFHTSAHQPTRQDPYDRGLISDALRKELGVPTQAEQEQRRIELDAGRAGAQRRTP